MARDSTIRLYRALNPGDTPASLNDGEVGIDEHLGKLFMRNPAGGVRAYPLIGDDSILQDIADLAPPANKAVLQLVPSPATLDVAHPDITFGNPINSAGFGDIVAEKTGSSATYAIAYSSVELAGKLLWGFGPAAPGAVEAVDALIVPTGADLDAQYDADVVTYSAATGALRVGSMVVDTLAAADAMTGNIAVVFDRDAKTIWIGLGDENGDIVWNDDVMADPASGVGGVDLSAYLGDATYHPGVGLTAGQAAGLSSSFMIEGSVPGVTPLAQYAVAWTENEDLGLTSTDVEVADTDSPYNGQTLSEAVTDVYTRIFTLELAGGLSAVDILTALLTVDGSGSGLDAALLEGQEGSYYETNLANITTAFAALSEKTMPADFDGFVVTDSANAGALVTYTWQGVWNALQETFDARYPQAVAGVPGPTIAAADLKNALAVNTDDVTAAASISEASVGSPGTELEFAL